ncbi:TetR/AcrR family transcriptional regulator [Actinoplanes sp. NPDC051411]|uniref:TetR/AcrR family transcriptional regulator n=1 Tax=Actinoplanes sp. NPDC051411 TaxID=3155522 RepID=UPI00341C54C9
MAATPSTTRPGGRSARVRAAVHQAVRELLAEQSAESLTLPVVADRAGVHPATLYRRWGSIAELITDVVSSRVSGEVVVPDTGSLREDLERWMSEVAADLSDPDGIAILRAAIGAGATASKACMIDRHAQLAAMLDREQARGGAVPEVDRAADALLGPLMYRAVFTDRPVRPHWLQDLVTALIEGGSTR